MNKHGAMVAKWQKFIIPAMTMTLNFLLLRNNASLFK